jgi:AcrR family transcriptional regulator
MDCLREGGKALPGQSVKVEQTRMPGEEQSRRQERAHRILDVAAELIQRWGYKKTTVDDIARQAGVAKGTIYLHWKTREDLFVTLLLRESLDAYRIMQERIDNDPEGVYMSHITKHSIAVIMARPLTRAVFMRDISVLGELLQSGREDLNFISQQKFLASEQLLALYRDKGVLRTNRSLSEQIKTFSALVVGFLTVDPYLPAQFRFSSDEVPELLASAVHEVMEPAEPVALSVLQELRGIWNQVIQQFVQMLEERLHKELA